jgi:hypothetical protein
MSSRWTVQVRVQPDAFTGLVERMEARGVQLMCCASSTASPVPRCGVLACCEPSASGPGLTVRFVDGAAPMTISVSRASFRDAAFALDLHHVIDPAA